MNKIEISFTNCYGIRSLSHEFEFGNAMPGNKTFAIYAPNGLMKTSFTRTFEKLAQGRTPEEERYNRPSTCQVLIDGNPISSDRIYVLKSDIDIQEDSPAITNILVNPEHKARYDSLLIDLDKQKTKLINSLQKKSGVAKKDIEKKLIEDAGINDFSSCIAMLKEGAIEEDFIELNYSTLFDPKAQEVLKSAEFIASAKEFNTRYQELFNQEGTIYSKGVFNPAKAEASFSTLDRQGFFAGGHLVQMRGSKSAIGKTELEVLLNKIHATIDSDEHLKKIRTGLAKNAQTQELTELLEKLTSDQIDRLLEKLRPENQDGFRRCLWSQYIQGNSDATYYLELHEQTKDEINAIEAQAAQAAPRWTEAVDLFNDRFVDMPFTLSIFNQTQAALGKEKARLKFTFRDGEDTVEWSRSEMKTLSQGEKRALYLLNFIFETKSRSQSTDETLFIIDDVADSFDYKNKHAIVQYLEDLDNSPRFYQIILTHNFDFFRTLANNFVHRKRCLMANRQIDGISLSIADGISNYFIGILKKKIHIDPRAMCATIPFTRNLIEYTKGEENQHYLRLTSLLHLKQDTSEITVKDYLDIYNEIFETNHPGDDRSIKQVLEEQALEISIEEDRSGLNLEDKVLLSMAIRMKSEEYLIQRIRILKNDPGYWCNSKSQFGALMKEFSKLDPTSSALRTLEKVSITVSSNIHLNSFMYEPILDLTVDHLISLYTEVSGL